ncbi:MAG TPA: CpaF family protein [Miltoncostaea sp.]|nr:CpaF family protein [Miltoncostaea sp.]
MGAVTDPALVEHLRARAARDPRVSGAVGLDRDELAELVDELIDEERRILPAAARAEVVQAVVDEALGLGPLESLLRDPAVTEIMVCGPASVFVERAGRITPAATRFADGAHVLHVIDRILAPLGRRVDEASPMVDARLPDGSRVNAVIPPLALDGPALTIRRFGGGPLTGDDLVALGTMDDAMRDVLGLAVRARRNVLVTGGTGSGKTTTLAALAAVVPPQERVITIEDAAELRIALPHVVRLESRPPSLEGSGAVPIRALVRNALRMRPDRIVVGEVRGAEALDMLTAMTTGHEGSLSTLHASSPADAVRRLQTLALMGDVDLPYRAVQEQVASAIDLVVHQSRLPDGRRRIVELAAVAAGPDGPELMTLCTRTRDGDGVQWTADAEAWAARCAADAGEGT